MFCCYRKNIYKGAGLTPPLNEAPLLMSTLSFDLYHEPREETGQKTKALHLHIIKIISNFASIGE